MFELSIFQLFRLCCRRNITTRIGLCRSCAEPTQGGELCVDCNAERETGRLSGTSDDLTGI
jgi:hypothetical protein